MLVFPYDTAFEEQRNFMTKIGVSAPGISIMSDRFALLTFVVHDISAVGANVLKQHLLHAGGEVAVPRDTVVGGDEKVTVLCSLPREKAALVAERLRSQWWGLTDVADFIDESVRFSLPWFSFSHRAFSRKRPAVMGVLNVTPDSFSDGGAYRSVDDAVQAALHMKEAGADIVDIGGESSRPGAESVTETEEMRRVVPVVERLAEILPEMPISVDTVKPAVAEAVLAAGASVINDISGIADPHLARVVARHNAALIVMHMQGTPRTMQHNPHYDNVLIEIAESLSHRVELAVQEGVPAEHIIVDPGIGFGKTTDHNLTIIKHLEWLTGLHYPILIGASRKALIGSITGERIPAQRDAGTIALHTMALERGAAVIRVHDVAGAVQSLRLFIAVREASCC